MGAPKRRTRESIRQAFRRHAGIKFELDRLERAANEQIRKSPFGLRYEPGEITEGFLDQLADVVNHNDWRPSVERTADQLRRAAMHMRKAVGLTVRALKGCPTYATIPSIIWESTPEAQAERRVIAASAKFNLFDALQTLREREGRAMIDPRNMELNFLTAMLVYATRCEREAARLDGILKTRASSYDRLGPILYLSKEVQELTGKPHDAIVARMLTDAFEVAGSPKEFSPDSLRKMRERHLTR